MPALWTFDGDGTVAVSDAAMFGGVAFNPYRISPMHGIWKRSGKDKILVTNLWMVFNPIWNPEYADQLNNLVGFGRVRAELQVKGFDRMEGTFWIDFLPCPSPLACSDPLDSDAAWVPYPTVGAVLPIPVTVQRMKSVPLP
jgi:hypothetical protein